MRCLVALADELSFRRAAARLHITQPPLSRSIAQLEALLGTRLFDRSRTHCTLTPQGTRAAADARRVLVELDACTARWAAAAAEPVPALRLGLFFALNPRHFRQIDRVVQALLDGLAPELIVDRTHHLLEQLRRRRLDAALVLLPAPTSGLVVHALAQTEMVALLPASSPLARRRRVRVSELAQAGPLLFMHERENPPLYQYLDEALRARGLARPHYRVPRDTYSGLADIAAGRACTVVCRTMADAARRDLAFRPLHQDDSIPVTLALVHGTELTPTRQSALLAGLRQYLGKVLEKV